MQSFDYYGSQPTRTTRDIALSHEDLEVVARLMRELQELTQSRGTFVAAGRLLRRITGETPDTSIVGADLAAQ